MTERGSRLRAAREAADLLLAQLARRTAYAKSYLGNVETGRRRVTPDVALAYERALGADMRRRVVLTGMATGLVAQTVIGALIEHGFTAAIDGRATEDDWHERTEAYGHDYMTTGPAALQGRLVGDLVVLQQQLETPALWGVAARLLTMYGNTTRAARESIRWYRLAAIAADRSQDVPLRVWVRGRAALVLGYSGIALSTARRLAHDAMALSDRQTVGRLNAALAMANVAAVRGERGAALVHLDLARRDFDATGSAERISDRAMPEWRLHTFTSMLLARLGDTRRAVAAQEAADRGRPPELTRFATHIELHRGLMMAKAGDAAEGVAYARGALDRLPAENHAQSHATLMAEIEASAARAR